jgi:hypothetical protein
MNIINPKRLEDLIVNLLMDGERATTELLSVIRINRKNTTKQGFYAALRKLKADEVILVYRKAVSLNTAWIKKMHEAFEIIEKTYTTDHKSFDVLDLEEKESISYAFSNIKNLDIFWGHSQNILIHNSQTSEPVYSYDPHYWFYIARKETEKELLKEIVAQKRQFLMTVAGQAKLDKIIKTDFNNDFLQYSYNKDLFKKKNNNYYITVIGDYITEVFLDEQISKEIDQLYKTDLDVEKASGILKNLLDKKGKSKIKISKNKTRAQKLKTKMGKDFYVIKQA